jgi:hypothetical protein
LHDNVKKKRQQTWPLVAGAVLGALLAASGVLEPGAPDLPGDRVAVVNGVPVSKSDYLGYLDLLARDKRNPMTTEDRRHVLERIIEEKLLIDRGLNIDLPHSDPKVRKTIVNAMIQIAISEASSEEPTDAELADFYTATIDYFTAPARVQVRRMVFRGDNAAQRAQLAHRQLSGDNWLTVQAEFADTDILALPNSPLPVSKLRGYLGPTLTEAALALPPQSFSPPLAEQSGYSILQLLALQAGVPRPLEEIRDQVVREFQRRAGDAALRDYLQQLRRGADISIDEDFLQQLDTLDVANDG